MKCKKHKNVEAVAMCTVCGSGMCGECDIRLAGRFYCQSCADDLVKEGAIVAIRKLYEILEEKRKHYRNYVLLSIEIIPSGYEGMYLKGIIHNISSGGMAVLTDKQISINEIVYISFTLPNGEVMENIQAGVVRSEKIGEKYNLGLLFMNLMDKQKLIDEFIFNSKKKKYTQEGPDISNYL